MSGRVVVVGGGLAGLTAATLAARRGCAVTLVERAEDPGGRARSSQVAGATLNLGPHALYEGGDARRVLASLGVSGRGGLAPSRGALAALDDRLTTLPVGPLSLLMTDLFSASEKLGAARLLAELGRRTPDDARGRSLDAWLALRGCAPRVAAFLHTLVRLATYADAPDRAEAHSALTQVRLGAAGVRYLDGGWQTLVDELTQKAAAAGVARTTGRAEEVTRAGGRVRGVRLRDGRSLEAEAVVLAVSPAEAARLAGAASLAGAARDATAIEAACLDLVLDTLPRPDARFCLAVDAPLYLSVHSLTARLVSPPAAVVHVARYLTPGTAPSPRGRAELEAFAERVQPGLLGAVREARYLPRLTVSHALVDRGLDARPAARVPDVPGLFVAGDWVGARGQLADAALASAEECANLAAAAAHGPGARAA